MCPMCITTAGLVVAGATSTSGLAALVAMRLRRKAAKKERTMDEHTVVSPAEWMAARKQLLIKEKEMTRQREQLAAERRELPWVRIEKRYMFDGPKGRETLSDLFDGRSQLIVKHFMFAPEQQEGCIGCSFTSDHVDGALPHLEAHDVSLVAVARAPLPILEAYKKRMGWRFKWVSSYGSDFNYDFHVSFAQDGAQKGHIFYNYERVASRSEELSGLSVFVKDASGNIFHTYSTYGRGEDAFLGTYAFLDITPKGRNEQGPAFGLMDWVRRHDSYARRPNDDRMGPV